jgi:hypothetical protein
MPGCPFETSELLPVDRQTNAPSVTAGGSTDQTWADAGNAIVPINGGGGVSYLDQTDSRHPFPDPTRQRAANAAVVLTAVCPTIVMFTIASYQLVF